ncbi:helix-turn-helix transcriptional regulator [Poseidonocella sedimentorum]|uniref:LuxR family transcriptional regulator n=1 Tax=Poseidonocella sedimentorum TaxID=871652 RepID=A0A1I6DGQ1_9RHOB|nr:LuxR family transcriptional regulator [Poseidonocella sedimentorum]SFR04558.1 LuxR family transcriptional regulator [Poseidonocella sedimentorum]
MNINAYLEAITDAQTIEELWDMHCRKMADYGFDRVIYGFTRFRSGTSLGDPGDFVVLTNYPPEFVSEYINEGLYFHGPMLQWALENDGACSWKIMEDMEASGVLSAQEKRVVEFNRKNGLRAGYTISFSSVSQRSKGGLSLVMPANSSHEDAEAIWAQHGADLMVINNVAHLKILTLPYNTAERSLTKRQREVLEWVGDGKTMQDIATLMGLTPATVEKHLRLAREALNVDTTAQAVLKAAFQNQMFVIER